MTFIGSVRRRLFGIPSERSVFSGPGFAPEAWIKFQPVAHSLVEGYHATLEDSRIGPLSRRLEKIDPQLQGFAYEGAGMGVEALDLIAPWTRRLDAFVSGPAGPHIYPTYVGAGLALARLRRDPERALKRLDPVLGWVVVDGYGFHEGFFSYHRSIQDQVVPASLSAYGRKVFDHGLGRSVWFLSGALLPRVVRTIARFDEERRAALWIGIGLASTFAGGLDRDGYVELATAASEYRAELALGAAIAAAGRSLAGSQTVHTEQACRVYCGRSAAELTSIADEAQRAAAEAGADNAHEDWHHRIRAALTPLEVAS